MDLSLFEIGNIKHSDGSTFPLIYRVGGLPSGDNCIIAFNGPGQWRVTYYRFNGEVPEVLPIAGVTLYKTPELALEALWDKIP
jgi:hypothetical protein